jgi:hypothetical protein
MNMRNALTEKERIKVFQLHFYLALYDSFNTDFD